MGDEEVDGPSPLLCLTLGTQPLEGPSLRGGEGSAEYDNSVSIKGPALYLLTGRIPRRPGANAQVDRLRPLNCEIKVVRIDNITNCD